MRSFLPLLSHAIEQHGKNVLKKKKHTISVYFYILMQYRECTIQWC